jgi:Do/DeqQ family serine protease
MMKRNLLAFVINLSVLLSFSTFSWAVLPAFYTDGKPYPSLSPMLKKVNPAVVNISTFSQQKNRYNPLLNDPYFKRFFNIPEGQPYSQRAPKKQQSAGSGVIVDAENGTVMTNFHVIKGASEVQVSLIDGRSYSATVLGSDPELDIAILQISAPDLVDVELADSNKAEVGDFVVAIGNPFGLGQTVTTGIVSALGRSGLGIEGYENFIQTDASINPGNSGGALVNLGGKLVGINTAILAPSGGNVGIGFAIPSNMAKASMEQILAHGEVKRGQIGVSIQDITSDLRDAFGLENGQTGVLISNVAEDSPAEKAGLKSGDIILAIDNSETKSTGQLRSQIGMKGIGDQVEVTILREGKFENIIVSIASPESMLVMKDNLHPLLQGAKFENDTSGKGVVVSSVAPNSSAAYSGLRPGDIIIAANKRRVHDLNSFQQLASLNQNSLLLQINRRGRSLFMVIR